MLHGAKNRLRQQALPAKRTETPTVIDRGGREHSSQNTMKRSHFARYPTISPRFKMPRARPCGDARIKPLHKRGSGTGFSCKSKGLQIASLLFHAACSTFWGLQPLALSRGDSPVL